MTIKHQVNCRMLAVPPMFFLVVLFIPITDNREPGTFVTLLVPITGNREPFTRLPLTVSRVVLFSPDYR